MQTEPVYWILTDGRCVCWSVAELAEKKPDELLDSNALQAAYETIGKELDFHPLGMLPDETFEEYRDNPGTLEERRHLSFFTFRQSAVDSNSLRPPELCSGLWERLRWKMPENEAEPCWRPYVLT